MKAILLSTIIFLLLAAFAIITSGSGEEKQKEVCFFTLFIDTLFGMTLHVLSSYVCKRCLWGTYEMILRSLDLLLRKIVNGKTSLRLSCINIISESDVFLKQTQIAECCAKCQV